MKVVNSMRNSDVLLWEFSEMGEGLAKEIEGGFMIERMVNVGFDMWVRL